jgi:hypothetical protein
MVAAEAVAGARRATTIIDPAASQPAAWRTPPLRREEVRRFIRDPRADDVTMIPKIGAVRTANGSCRMIPVPVQYQWPWPTALNITGSKCRVQNR